MNRDCRVTILFLGVSQVAHGLTDLGIFRVIIID
jgi:hypothetical protein